jgi:hypothetical protein
MSLKNLRAFGETFDVEVTRQAENLQVAVTLPGREPIAQSITPGETLIIRLGANAAIQRGENK